MGRASPGGVLNKLGATTTGSYIGASMMGGRSRRSFLLFHFSLHVWNCLRQRKSFADLHFPHRAVALSNRRRRKVRVYVHVLLPNGHLLAWVDAKTAVGGGSSFGNEAYQLSSDLFREGHLSESPKWGPNLQCDVICEAPKPTLPKKEVDRS